MLALDADRVLALLGQRRVVHDQHGVLAAYQGVSRPAQHLFQRGGGPGRGRYKVVKLLRLPGAHTFGHWLDTLARPWSYKYLKVSGCPATLLGTLKNRQEWFKPFLKIFIPIGANRNCGIHEYPSGQAYSEILRFHMAE